MRSIALITALAVGPRLVLGMPDSGFPDPIQRPACPAVVLAQVDKFEESLTEAEQVALQGLDESPMGRRYFVEHIRTETGAEPGMPEETLRDGQKGIRFLLGRLIIWNQLKNSPDIAVPAAGKIIAVRTRQRPGGVEYWVTVAHAAMVQNGKPKHSTFKITDPTKFLFRQSPNLEHLNATVSDYDRAFLSAFPTQRFVASGDQLTQEMTRAQRDFRRALLVAGWQTGLPHSVHTEAESAEFLLGKFVAVEAQEVHLLMDPNNPNSPVRSTRTMQHMTGKAVGARGFMGRDGVLRIQLTLMTADAKIHFFFGLTASAIHWNAGADDGSHQADTLAVDESILLRKIGRHDDKWISTVIDDMETETLEIESTVNRIRAKIDLLGHRSSVQTLAGPLSTEQLAQLEGKLVLGICFKFDTENDSTEVTRRVVGGRFMAVRPWENTITGPRASVRVQAPRQTLVVVTDAGVKELTLQHERSARSDSDSWSAVHRLIVIDP